MVGLTPLQTGVLMPQGGLVEPWCWPQVLHGKGFPQGYPQVRSRTRLEKSGGLTRRAAEFTELGCSTATGAELGQGPAQLLCVAAYPPVKTSLPEPGLHWPDEQHICKGWTQPGCQGSVWLLG